MFLKIPIEILSEKRLEHQLFGFGDLELELGLKKLMFQRIVLQILKKQLKKSLKQLSPKKLMFLRIPIEILYATMLGTSTFLYQKKLMFLKNPIEILSEKKLEHQLFGFGDLELGAGSWSWSWD